jgi:hypothetical protein
LPTVYKSPPNTLRKLEDTETDRKRERSDGENAATKAGATGYRERGRRGLHSPIPTALVAQVRTPTPHTRTQRERRTESREKLHDSVPNFAEKYLKKALVFMVPNKYQ